MAPPEWLYKPVGSNDRQVTRAERGHVLHHSGVWSPDSTWIVYDTRGDAAGDVFDGAEIQAVNARTREVRTLFTASNGAKCGMASFNPVPHKREIVFTLGPENPTGAWTYAPHRRRGALADCSTALKFRQNPGDRHGGATRANEPPNLSPSSNDTGEGGAAKRTNAPTRTRAGDARILDARDLLPDADGAFTPGALRGGTAAHAFSPDGLLVSAAYEDAVLLRNANLSEYADASPPVERAFRSIAIVAMDGKGGVAVDTSEHPRNHSGEGFAVVATRHVGDAGAARARRRRRRGRGRAPRRARRGRVLGRAAGGTGGAPPPRGGGKAARWPSSGRWTRTRTAATTKDVRSLRPNREPGDVGRVGPGPARKKPAAGGNTSSFSCSICQWTPRRCAWLRRRRRRSRVPPNDAPAPPFGVAQRDA